jgi:hypothetical protein
VALWPGSAKGHSCWRPGSSSWLQSRWCYPSNAATERVASDSTGQAVESLPIPPLLQTRRLLPHALGRIASWPNELARRSMAGSTLIIQGH